METEQTQWDRETPPAHPTPPRSPGKRQPGGTDSAAGVRLRRRPPAYDLILLIGLALLAPVLPLLPLPPLRVPLGLGLALLAPGYALTAAIFPDRQQLDGASRAALSFGLSVAVLPVLALLLNTLPWGIRPWPIALALTLWIVPLCAVALVRRAWAPEKSRYTSPAQASPRTWRARSNRGLAGSTLGALALAGALVAAGALLLAPNPPPRMTEFYALGPAGLAEHYPREVAPAGEMRLQLGIVNREGTAARYRVEARSKGQLLAQLDPIALEDGATWEGPLRYALARPGDNQQVDILLFYNDEPYHYRQLRLWVDVREAP